MSWAQCTIVAYQRGGVWCREATCVLDVAYLLLTVLPVASKLRPPHCSNLPSQCHLFHSRIESVRDPYISPYRG